MDRWSRRDLAAAIAAIAMSSNTASAQAPEDAAVPVQFVPGGRIGFKRFGDVRAHANAWHLLSKDQTLQVQVSEALRIDAIWDARLWEQDDRHALVTSDSPSPGIERRRFHERRYGDDADYGADVDVLRDDGWIGQVRISTSTLGSAGLSVPGGQIARWRATVEALRDSVTVRPPPSAAQALAEHRIALAVEGLNPRFAGDRLVLSLTPPPTPAHAAGVTGAHIDVPGLARLPFLDPQALVKATAAAFEAYRGFPGSRVVNGPSCRGVMLRENDVTDTTFGITLMAFGRTRELKLTAFYGRADREPMVKMLEGLIASLALPDGE
jgi:hypothetical protein